MKERWMKERHVARDGVGQSVGVTGSRGFFILPEALYVVLPWNGGWWDMREASVGSRRGRSVTVACRRPPGSFTNEMEKWSYLKKERDRWPRGIWRVIIWQQWAARTMTGWGDKIREINEEEVPVLWGAEYVHGVWLHSGASMDGPYEDSPTHTKEMGIWFFIAALVVIVKNCM